MKPFLDRYRERKGKPVDIRLVVLAIKILYQLKTMLAGYKTYIAGVVAIITAIGGYLSDSISVSDALQAILTAIMGMTIRSGVTTEKEKTK